MLKLLTGLKLKLLPVRDYVFLNINPGNKLQRMIYPKTPLAQSIIEIYRAKGITNIVISPGSRTAPLTIGGANNPAFACYSIADERCAAFFGMGMAQQIKTPVA